MFEDASYSYKSLNILFSLSFQQEAKNAIKGMNGQFLGGKVIRTNWASRKPSEQKTESKFATPLTAFAVPRFLKFFPSSGYTSCYMFKDSIHI